MAANFSQLSNKAQTNALVDQFSTGAVAGSTNLSWLKAHARKSPALRRAIAKFFGITAAEALPAAK